MSYKDPKTKKNYPSKQWMFSHWKTLPEVRRAYPNYGKVQQSKKAPKQTATGEKKYAIQFRNKQGTLITTSGGIEKVKKYQKYSDFKAGPFSDAYVRQLLSKAEKDKKKPPIKPEPPKEPKEGEEPEEPSVKPEEPEELTDPANIIDDAGELIIPQELQDDPYFTQLDPDMQAMAIYSWNITQTEQVASEAETKAYQDAFLEAIDEATLQSNPYFAEQLRMIKDEFQRTIGTLSDDLASVERTIATHKAQIEEDLEYNKDQITVEQQAELSRREKEYKVQLDSTREQMAQKGLSFSSIRTQAEEKLGVAQKDIIESTERRYARQLRSLTIGSERGLEGLVTQLEESRRKTEEAKTSATRGAEKQIGSELLDLPETEQYELGGIYGAPWQKMKQEDIFTRAQNILKLEFPM